MNRTQNENLIETTTSFLSFKLGNEFFAIPVMKVMEIVEVPPITRIPQSPTFLKGVINLRGAVLPVIDGRIKFGIPATELTISTCIVVLDIELDEEFVQVGALVDSVLGVFEIEEKDIQPSPTIGAKYRADFIQGMIKKEEEFIMLLNIDKVFSALELDIMTDTNNEDIAAAAPADTAE